MTISAIQNTVYVERSVSKRSWHVKADTQADMIVVSYDKNDALNNPDPYAVDNAKNKYAFRTDVAIKQKQFQEAAQQIVGKGLLPLLMIDALVMSEDEIFLYSEDNSEDDTTWLRDRLLTDAAENDVCVTLAHLDANGKSLLAVSLRSIDDDALDFAGVKRLFDGPTPTS